MVLWPFSSNNLYVHSCKLPASPAFTCLITVDDMWESSLKREFGANFSFSSKEIWEKHISLINFSSNEDLLFARNLGWFSKVSNLIFPSTVCLLPFGTLWTEVRFFFFLILAAHCCSLHNLTDSPYSYNISHFAVICYLFIPLEWSLPVR